MTVPMSITERQGRNSLERKDRTGQGGCLQLTTAPMAGVVEGERRKGQQVKRDKRRGRRERSYN